MTDNVRTAEDMGQSKQPAIRPVFVKVAPVLVRPFQKAMKTVTPSARKKLLNTYLKNVSLQGDPGSKKNTKIIREILVKALIKDRGFIEFVAEQILDGSPELADVLAPARTAAVHTASVVDSIYEGSYPTSEDDFASVEFPVTIELMGQSDNWYRLSSVARAEGLSDGTHITLNDESDCVALFSALESEASDNAEAMEQQMYEDFQSEGEGKTEDEYLDENLNEYMTDVHEPAAILAAELGL